MKNILRFDIEVNDGLDTDHVEILVRTTGLADANDNPDDYGNPTERELAEYTLMAAGILARVGLEAVKEVEAEAHRHHCAAHGSDGHPMGECCGVGMLDVLNATWWNPPNLWVCVPTDECEEWEERLSGYLSELFANDAKLRALQPGEVERPQQEEPPRPVPVPAPRPAPVKELPPEDPPLPPLTPERSAEIMEGLRERGRQQRWEQSVRTINQYGGDRCSRCDDWVYRIEDAEPDEDGNPQHKGTCPKVTSLQAHKSGSAAS